MSEEQELDGLFDDARFGIEVERFISTGIGRYLIDRAEIERNKAINLLKDVDASNTEEVRKLQNDLKIPDLVTRWLHDAIQEGRAAELQLNEMEQV